MPTYSVKVQRVYTITANSEEEAEETALSHLDRDDVCTEVEEVPFYDERWVDYDTTGDE